MASSGIKYDRDCGARSASEGKTRSNHFAYRDSQVSRRNHFPSCENAFDDEERREKARNRGILFLNYRRAAEIARERKSGLGVSPLLSSERLFIPLPLSLGRSLPIRLTSLLAFAFPSPASPTQRATPLRASATKILSTWSGYLNDLCTLARNDFVRRKQTRADRYSVARALSPLLKALESKSRQ